MIIKKIISAVLLSLLFSFVVSAQSGSVYTRYGIGDMDYTYSARSLGIGHTGTAQMNRDYVEILNPASWTALNFTRIEFSLVLNGVLLKDANKSTYLTDADFKGFTFAFPISRKYGIGFASGLIPYSRISYEIIQKNKAVAPVTSDYTTTYEGSGGLTRLFLGSTFRTSFDWTIGATLEYYFGTLKYDSKVDFDNPKFKSTNYELIYRPTGFGTTVGLISQDLSGLFNSETISNLRLGVSVNFISNLTTDTSLVTDPNTRVDTISSGNTTLKVPVRVSAGLSMVLADEYNINLDYLYQPWTDFRIGSKHFNELRDVHKISAGFEYYPKRSLKSSFLEQIVWRAGLSYELSQYNINSTGINQYSVFGGFSIPLGVGNSFDLGLEYSYRGTTEANLIRENFFRINIGISFGELWFVRIQR